MVDIQFPVLDLTCSVFVHIHILNTFGISDAIYLSLKVKYVERKKNQPNFPLQSSGIYSIEYTNHTHK